MTKDFEQKRALIECLKLLDAMIDSELGAVTIVPPQGQRSRQSVLTLLKMGLIEPRQENVFALTCQSGSMSAMDLMRARYEFYLDEDNQNYEMLADGFDPYVDPVPAPSPGKRLVDRTESFEDFVDLCIQLAEKQARAEWMEREYSALGL